jgi:hypothetical protein
MININTEHVSISLPERATKFDTLCESMIAAFHALDIEYATTRNGAMGVHTYTQIDNDVHYAHHVAGNSMAIWIYSPSASDEDLTLIRRLAGMGYKFSHCELIYPLILTDKSFDRILDIAKDIYENFRNDTSLGIAKIRVY